MDLEEGCETCWSYALLTRGREPRCPWCAGHPPKVKATEFDSTKSLVAKLGHARKRAESSRAGEAELGAIVAKMVALAAA